MTANNFKWPPEGKEIVVSLRESNGEHGLYSCIYMGMGIFKFLQNDKQYAIESKKVQNKHPEYEWFLIGKPFISWWIPKKKKEVQNDSTSTVL